MHVLVTADPTPGDKDFYSRWERFGPVWRRTFSANPHNVSFEILVVDHRSNVTEQFLKQFPKLKYVCSATTGHTHLQFDAKKLGIKLITLRGESEFLSSVRSVSEFCFMLMLSLSRPIGSIGTVLNGKTLGIVGLGRIGKHMLDIAQGFKMHILTWDKGDPYQKLMGLFSSADYVSIHLAEVPETHGLINKHLIERMKKSAYFINSARASIVDEDALLTAVTTGKIAGAALDVTSQPHTEFAPNLIITDHIAGFTKEDRIKTDEFIVSKLERLLHAH